MALPVYEKFTIAVADEWVPLTIEEMQELSERYQKQFAAEIAAGPALIGKAESAKRERDRVQEVYNLEEEQAKKNADKLAKDLAQAHSERMDAVRDLIDKGQKHTPDKLEFVLDANILYIKTAAGRVEASTITFPSDIDDAIKKFETTVKNYNTQYALAEDASNNWLSYYDPPPVGHALKPAKMELDAKEAELVAAIIPVYKIEAAQKAAQAVSDKQTQEDELKLKSQQVGSALQGYAQQPNAYQGIKDLLNNDASITGGINPGPVLDSAKYAKAVDDIIAGIKDVENDYRQLPANARSMWRRRLERRNYYKNVAQEVRTKHAEEAKAYRSLRDDLRSRIKNAKQEVVAAIEAEKKLVREAYHDELKEMNWLQRVVSKYTGGFGRRWRGHDFNKDVNSQTRELQGFYKDLKSDVESHEEVAKGARERLRKTLNEQSINALRK